MKWQHYPVPVFWVLGLERLLSIHLSQLLGQLLPLAAPQKYLCTLTEPTGELDKMLPLTKFFKDAP